MLLEKAFAKLYGSFGAIEAGLTHEALMDLTGGLGHLNSRRLTTQHGLLKRTTDRLGVLGINNSTFVC